MDETLLIPIGVDRSTIVACTAIRRPLQMTMTATRAAGWRKKNYWNADEGYRT